MPRRTGHRAGTDHTPTRRPGGRPPVVADHQRVTVLLEAIRAGVPITHALTHAGIGEASHSRAMQAGQAADQAAEAGHTLTEREHAYRRYRRDVERARAAVAVAHVALLGKVARGGQVVRKTTRTLPDGTVEEEEERARPEWRASTWLLERSFRQEFGRDAARVEVTGADGGPIEHVGPGEEALAAIAERLAQVAEQQRRQLPGGWDAPAAIESTRLDREPLDVETVDVDEDGAR